MDTQGKKDLSIRKQLSRHWGWLLALGVLFVFLGTVGLGLVVGLTLVSVLFIGVILLVAGGVQLVDVFKCRSWEGAIWHALIAVLYIIAGLVIIYDPVLASTVMTAFIASVLIVIGIIRIAMAFRLRGSRGWGWILAAGLMALVLGLLIFIQWPWSGLWVIGLFIAIELLLTGWTYIFMAVALRKT